MFVLNRRNRIYTGGRRRRESDKNKNKKEDKITTTSRSYLPDLVLASSSSAISTKHAARDRSRRISSVLSWSISEAASIAARLFPTSLPLPLSLPEGLTSTSDDVTAVPKTLPCVSSAKLLCPTRFPVGDASRRTCRFGR